MTLPGTPSIPPSGVGALVAQRYEVLAHIGTGGMGAVYKVRDHALDEIVALKTLRNDALDAGGSLAERLRQEVKLARRIAHPNVARIHDIGEVDSTRFLTMEFVDGMSLATLHEERRLDQEEIRRIAADIAAGLAAAHDRGVVHRDLKPDNVLREHSGRVVITDFGVARLAGDGAARITGNASIVGTPAYMAPEQVEGADVDHRADLYALGIIVFELLSGQLPFSGHTPLSQASARLTQEPKSLKSCTRGLPEALLELVDGLLSRDPKKRPASAHEVHARLSSLTLPHEVPCPPSRRNPAALESAVTIAAHADATPAPLLTLFLAHAKRVGVLPFRESSDGPAIARGLAQDLVDSLSMTSGLRVRTAQRDEGEDFVALGERLQVEFIVDGSIRRDPEGILLSVRVISTRDGFQVWAHRFRTTSADLLATNDRAAGMIAEALTVPLASRQRGAVTDPIAVELYLQWRREYHEDWVWDAQRSLDLLEKARSRAPRDPTIVASCALARARLWFRDGMHEDQAWQLAHAALAAGPSHPDALLAFGMVNLIAGENPTATRYLRRAQTRRPGHAEAAYHLGRILLEAGPLEEAMRQLRRAQELDAAFENDARLNMYRGHALMGRWDLVEPLFTQEQSTGALIFRARMDAWRGRGAAAIETVRVVEQALRHRGQDEFQDMAQSLLACWESKASDLPAPREDPNRRYSPRRVAFHYQLLAEVAAVAESREGCIEALIRADEGGLWDVMWLDHCPVLAFVRDDPRFVRVHKNVADRSRGVVDAYEEPVRETDARGP